MNLDAGQRSANATSTQRRQQQVHNNNVNTNIGSNAINYTLKKETIRITNAGSRTGGSG